MNDRMPTGDTDSQQASDGTPTGHVTVSVGEAASRLGVTPDAIRSRLHRGTLEGEKVDGTWQVHLRSVVLGPSPENDRQDGPVAPTGDQQGATGQPTGTDGQATGHATVDLAPLAEVIERLSRQVDERDQRIQEQHERIETLSSSEAMWRTHALHLQNRVAELEELTSIEAGQSSTDESAESPEQDDADTDTQAPSGDRESFRTSVEDIPAQMASTKAERRARVDLIAGDITVPPLEERKSAQRWWERWMRRLVRRSDVDS